MRKIRGLVCRHCSFIQEKLKLASSHECLTPNTTSRHSLTRIYVPLSAGVEVLLAAVFSLRYISFTRHKLDLLVKSIIKGCFDV